MKNLTKTITAKEIRTLNLKHLDVIGFEYLYENNQDNNYMLINGERVLNFTNQSDRRKSKDKIQRMSLGNGWLQPQLTDEEAGLVQAAELGLEIPKCQVIYA